MGVLAEAFDLIVAGTDVLRVTPTFRYTICTHHQHTIARGLAWWASSLPGEVRPSRLMTHCTKLKRMMTTWSFMMPEGASCSTYLTWVRTGTKGLMLDDWRSLCGNDRQVLDTD